MRVEGCVFAVITVYQQSTGVCYQQVCFIDRCVSLRLHTFYWQWWNWNAGIVSFNKLFQLTKWVRLTFGFISLSQSFLLCWFGRMLLLWYHRDLTTVFLGFSSGPLMALWRIFCTWLYLLIHSIQILTRTALSLWSFKNSTGRSGLLDMNLCLCFGRLKLILCYIFSSIFLFSAFFILVSWHKSWVMSLLYVRDQRSFESWKRFTPYISFCCYTTLCINNLNMYQVCCHTCTVLTYDQQQIDRGPLRIGRTTVPAHLVVRVFPETQRHLTAGQSALDTWRQPVHPEGQILWRINRQAVGRGRG